MKKRMKMKKYAAGGMSDDDEGYDAYTTRVVDEDTDEVIYEKPGPKYKESKPAAKKAEPKKAAPKKVEDDTSAYFGRARPRTAPTAKSSPGLMESLRSLYNRPRTYATPAEEERARKLVDAKSGGMKKGGSVKSSASRRADGIAQRGKTKGRMI